ncbi:MAG: PEP-CTERM sorting domain-containing protein [Limisphaerales bacterium]
MNTLKTKVLAAAFCGVIVSGLAFTAKGNLVQNGDFSSVSGSTSESGAGQIAGGVTSYAATVAHWTSSGYNFVYSGGSSSATLNMAEVNGAPDQFSTSVAFYGPLNPTPVANGFTTSPAGPNFVALDSYLAPNAGVSVGPLSQTINGLTVGQSYTLTFDWAGAQQVGYNGATTDQLAVTLGSETQDTPVIDVANHGFTGWDQVSFNYIATASSETLSFLASGTPAVTDPPFALLDGVDLELSAPDASSTAMLFGFSAAALAFASRRYNRRSRH